MVDSFFIFEMMRFTYEELQENFIPVSTDPVVEKYAPLQQ